MTTKKEIQAMFGRPLKTDYTSQGDLIWHYEYQEGSAFNLATIGSQVLTFGLAGTKVKGQKHEWVILFDANDQVKRFNMADSKLESGTMLFSK